MNSFDKEHILKTYFTKVHNLINPEYLTDQCFHSELYGDSNLHKQDMINTMTPIISMSKEITISHNRSTLIDEDFVFLPEPKDAVQLYEEGKKICISSYSIREEYSNNHEKVLLEIERKVTILEFIIYIKSYVGYPKDIDFEKNSHEKLFIILFKFYLEKIKKRARDENYIFQLVQEFYPDFSLNIYGIIDHVLNSVDDKELSNILYEEIKKELFSS